MALSAEDRYPTASDFRGALRRVGRSELPATSSTGNLCVTESALRAKTNQKVYRQALPASIDPFESYSILRPAETAWLLPKQGRQPAVVAAMLVIILLISVGAFYGVGQWTEAKDSLRDFARTTSSKSGSSLPAVHQTKSEKVRVGSSAPVTASTPSVDPTRKSEKQKRAPRRSDSARAKSPNLIPPPFSILP
jgi:hypothetical protein